MERPAITALSQIVNPLVDLSKSRVEALAMSPAGHDPDPDDQPGAFGPGTGGSALTIDAHWSEPGVARTPKVRLGHTRC